LKLVEVLNRFAVELGYPKKSAASNLGPKLHIGPQRVVWVAQDGESIDVL